MFKIGIISGAVSGGVANGLLNNLVSYYKSDTSGSFPDAHGSNNGSINGATYTASGKINGAYSYDGVNDFVSFGTTGYPSGSTNRTINLWFNPTSLNTSDEYIFDYGSNSAGARYGIVASTTYIGHVQHSAFIKYNASMSTGTWYMITSVLDGTTCGDVSFYLNGSLLTTINSSVNTGNIVNTILSAGRIGCFVGNSLFSNGVIDEIGVWDTALSASDISNLYNSGTGLSYNSFTS